MKRKQLSQMGRFQLKFQVQLRQSSIIQLLKTKKHTWETFTMEISKAERVLKMNNRNNLLDELKSNLAFQDSKIKTIPYVVFPSSF